jgi:outer membrane protein TolC
MDRIIKLTLILAMSLPAGLRAQEAALSLDSVLSRINRNNHMLWEYDSRAEAMREITEGARSWMAPVVGAGTFMTPYPGQQVQDPRDEGFWMISAEQEIPNPAKLRASQSYFASRAVLEEHGRAWKFNELRAAARSLYFEVAVLTKKAVLLRESEEIANWMLRVAEVRYPYGQSRLQDVYAAQGRIAEIENMILMNEGEIADRKSQLSALMNERGLSFDVDTLDLPPVGLPLKDADTSLLGGLRSDIRKLDHSVEVMRLNRQLQRAQAKPDFKVRFDHMSPFGSMMPSAFTVMGMVTIPVVPWSSKMYKAESRAMDYEIESLQHERMGILIETETLLRGMRSRLNQIERQLDNFQSRIVPAMKRSYEAARLAYEENRGQLSGVIDAWEGVNMAQLEYLDKLNEYYQMLVSYEKELEK